MPYHCNHNGWEEEVHGDSEEEGAEQAAKVKGKERRALGHLLDAHHTCVYQYPYVCMYVCMSLCL
jgi:hypothetical protein